jgi:hypothetical protein
MSRDWASRNSALSGWGCAMRARFAPAATRCPISTGSCCSTPSMPARRSGRWTSTLGPDMGNRGATSFERIFNHLRRLHHVGTSARGTRVPENGTHKLRIMTRASSPCSPRSSSRLVLPRKRPNSATPRAARSKRSRKRRARRPVSFGLTHSPAGGQGYESPLDGERRIAAKTKPQRPRPDLLERLAAAAASFLRFGGQISQRQNAGCSIRG